MRNGLACCRSGAATGTTVHRVVFASIVAVVANCGPSDRPLPPSSNDSIPVVGPDAAELANAPTIQLQEMGRIDGNASENSFSHISAIAVSLAGDLYVADQSSSTITVYDSAGRPLRSIGRAGDGPGELRSPSRMTIGGDTLFVVDLRGLNRFLLHGQFLDRILIQNPPYLEGMGRGLLYPQSLHATVHGLLVSFLPRSAATDEIVRDTTTIHILDPVTGISGPAIASMVSSDRIPIGPATSSGPWFAVFPHYTASSAGTIFITHEDGAHVNAIPAGSPGEIHRIRIGADRRRVTSQDVTSAQDRTVDAIRTLGRVPANAEEWEARLRSLPHAEYWPIVGRMLAGPEGELLVERPDLNPEHGALRSTTVWSLLNADASIVGHISLGPGITPMAVVDATLIAISRDDLDVPSVLLYEMVLPDMIEGSDRKAASAHPR